MIELELDVDESNALQHFSRPFKKVEHVTLECPLPSSKRQTIPFNQLFPALRSISLKLFKTSLYVRRMIQEDIDYVVDLLDTNPQIQNISLDRYEPEILEKISLMPHLEQLTFTWFGRGTPTTFENVTKFTAGRNNGPFNWRFPKLQELTIFYESNYEDWEEFLNVHRNLKRFHFNAIGWMRDHHFRGLTSILRNLEELVFDSEQEHSIEVETIIEFIERHEQLKKLHLQKWRESDKEFLQSKFSDKWTITNTSVGLLFERK